MNLFEKFGCGDFSLPLDVFCQHWGIIDPKDQARFLGQLAVESQNFSRVVENLHYKPERLLEVFKGRNGLNTLADATLICEGGPARIARKIYGMPWGAKIGNESNDDGDRFIGRGLIMLTGRTNYRDASYGCYGDDRLLQNPELLQQIEVAANVACWFWYNRKLSNISDIEVITQRVNGGLTALNERIAATNRAMSLCRA